jgi:hypothetical protein
VPTAELDPDGVESKNVFALDGTFPKTNILEDEHDL